jgi:Flp pilus assembly pilin Flp
MSRQAALTIELKTQMSREDGQTMPEYAIALMLITSATVALFGNVLSGSIATAITNVARLLP